MKKLMKMTLATEKTFKDGCAESISQADLFTCQFGSAPEPELSCKE